MNTTVNVDFVITTPKQLVEAFNVWMAKYEADPDSFNEREGDYATDCAAFLLDILKDLNGEVK